MRALAGVEEASEIARDAGDIAAPAETVHEEERAAGGMEGGEKGAVVEDRHEEDVEARCRGLRRRCHGVRGGGGGAGSGCQC